MVVLQGAREVIYTPCLEMALTDIGIPFISCNLVHDDNSSQWSTEYC
jgi:hypothetical protein